MRSSSARDSFIVMVLLRFISKTICPGPSMVLRPASPKEVPLGFAQLPPEAGVLEPKEEAGEQNAAVLNHSNVVGLLRETGAPVALARSEPLTPRLMSNEFPSTRVVKCSPEPTVKSPLHCQPSRMCESGPRCAKGWFSPKGNSEIQLPVNSRPWSK